MKESVCRSRMDWMRWAWLVLCLIAGTASAEGVEPGEASEAAGAERNAAVLAVLEEYMQALNELDIEGHVTTYHFPHFRQASGELAVWANAEEAMPILGVPKAERRAQLVKVLGEGWHHSEWTRREIVQGDDTKVHVLTTFTRYREDGSEIASFDSLYILTFENGRWGIKGRSSFAP